MCRYSDESYAQDTKMIIAQIVDWVLVTLGRPAWTTQYPFTPEEAKGAKYFQSYGITSFLVRSGSIVAEDNVATTWISGAFLEELRIVIKLRQQETRLYQQQLDRTPEEIARDDDRSHFVSALVQLHCILENAYNRTKHRNNRDRRHDSNETTSLILVNTYASLSDLSTQFEPKSRSVLDLCSVRREQAPSKSPTLASAASDILEAQVTVGIDRNAGPTPDLHKPAGGHVDTFHDRDPYQSIGATRRFS